MRPEICQGIGLQADIFSTTADSEETKAAGETKPEDSEFDQAPYAPPVLTFELISCSTPAAMEVDQPSKSTKSKKGKIVKRRGRKSNIVFPKFGDRNKKKR